MIQADENNQLLGIEEVLLHESVHAIIDVDPDFALTLISARLKLDKEFRWSDFYETDIESTIVTVYVPTESLDIVVNREKDLKDIMETVAPWIEGMDQKEIYLEFKIDPYAISVNWRNDFRNNIEAQQML